jgi:glyoxylate reductase
MARCFVTRRLPGDALERLSAAHEVDVWPEQLPPSANELLERAAGCEGLITLLTDRVDAEFMDALPDLRAVANYAVGTDNIDLEAATERGIAAGNTPEVLTDATADLAFALILAGARRLEQGARDVRAGAWLTWEPSGWLGFDVHGATLGIVGFGRIGRAVAKRASGFEMTVLHHDVDDDSTPLD